MSNFPTRSEADPESEAAALRAKEKDVARRSVQHAQTWGDGPPFFSEGSAAFWADLARGEFRLGRCSRCADVHFPPRVVCPACWTPDSAELIDTPGLGRIVSFTEMHVVATSLASLAPLLIVVVDLDEGVRLLTWLRGDDDRRVRSGHRCAVKVETVLGRPRFVARLVD